MRASNEIRQKSLQAFKNGINHSIRIQKKKKKWYKVRYRFIISTSSILAASIAMLLVYNDFFQNESLDPNVEVQQSVSDRSFVLNDIRENNDVLEKVLNKYPYDYEDINSLGYHDISNDSLTIRLPTGWSVENTDNEKINIAKINGTNSENMNLYLFNEMDSSYQEEIIDDFISNIAVSNVKSTKIPNTLLTNEIRINFDIGFPHDEILPINMEEAEIYAFIDEENERFMELYIGEIYGQPMVFTVDIPLNQQESWAISWIVLSFMIIQDSPPYVVHGSEGESDPTTYNRPITQSVILPIGAFGYEEVPVELYINEELGISSYLPVGTNVERIEHEYFTEFRFTEDNVSENSFYAFGKLKDSFQLDHAKEIMFSSFNIDLGYYEDLGGGQPYHYSYYSGMDEAFIDGWFNLFELSGDWYYIHKHADRSDYNGGVYSQRLRMFEELIETIETHD